MPYGNATSDNPDFIYPNKNIRFLDAQRGLDRSKGGDKPLTYAQRSFKIQRGYIRNLEPATLLKGFRSTRCAFQFNPQEIRQNVQMREDIYNPILLTAEQLSQPIGGNVSFQFDLFFDRSPELSANTKGPVSSSITEYMYDPSNKGPDQIGVYADLRVLYNIIGQGLSQDTIDLQLEMLRNTYNAKVARDAAYSESTATDATSTTNTTPAVETTDAFNRDFTDQASLEKLLGDNKGNAAFLLPNPVRIVFSPLLMVDGFVTSTSVDFLKFNNDMVPMQCRVAMGVNALYIGFAKERTFLTTTIETGKNALIQENKTDTEAIKPVEQAITAISTMRPFRMGFGVIKPSPSNPNSLYAPKWDEAMQNGTIPYCSLYYYLMPNSYINENFESGAQMIRVGYAGFPSIKPVAGGGKDIDPILTLFEDTNVNFTIGYDWGFTIYGKAKQNDYNGVGWSASEASAILNNKDYGDSNLSVIVGNYSMTERATEKKQWGSGASGSGAGDECIRRRTYLNNDKLSNFNSYDLLFDSSTRRDNIKNSYYIVAYTFKLVAETGSVTREYSYSNANNYIAVIKGDGKTGVFNKAPSNVTTIDKYIA